LFIADTKTSSQERSALMGAVSAATAFSFK
jgi:hypothetical protein